MKMIAPRRGFPIRDRRAACEASQAMVAQPAARASAALLRACVFMLLICVQPVAGQTQDRPDAGAFPHDPGLFPVLSMEPGVAQLDSMAAFAARVVYDVDDTLAVIAENEELHPLLRANAALLIGRRRDLEHFIILRPLLDARDPRIRLAVVAAAQEYLHALPDEALSILGAALRDPEEAVQVRALEAMADRDARRLREYLATDPAAPLATVAEGLLRAAEQRGAPLEAAADGTLGSTGPGGHRLVYRPGSAWPTPDLSAGTLELVAPDGATTTLGQAVEVARNVVPAFFSSDGGHIVFEDGRTIRVHDTESGRTRTVGEGIAPRPLPFTEDFVYAVPLDQSGTETRGQTRITYELRRSPFASSPESSPEPIGSVVATASFGVTGGASPVRWMRVTEDDGRFSLRGEGIEPVPLPDPFAEIGR